MTTNDIERIKKNAKKIDVYLFPDIGQILKQLVELHNNGEYDYYVEILGQKVYSVDVDYEEDFKRIIGMYPHELEREIKLIQEEQNTKFDLLKKNAKGHLKTRIKYGSKEVSEAKKTIWEEFVRINSDEPYYYVGAIDAIIRYLQLLNTSIRIENIASTFMKEFPEAGDWYTSSILSNIAKFHERGIDLFREIGNILRKSGRNVHDNTLFLDKLTRIEGLLKNGYDYDFADYITNLEYYRIDFDNQIYSVIENDENIFYGTDSNNEKLVIGKCINQNFQVVYVIDSTGNYKRYIFSNKDLVNLVQISDSNGTLIEQTEDKLLISNISDDIEVLVPLYIETANLLEKKIPINTILKVYNDIRELEKPIKDLNNKLTIEAISFVNENKAKALKLEAQ